MQQQQQQHNNLNQAWYQEMAKTVVPGLQERLRSLVNGKGWDYVVYWKLSDDQRFIDWVGCCCGGVAPGHGMQSPGLRPDCYGATHYMDGGAGPCPDISFPHPSTKTCGLLSNLALTPSTPLDSAGVHAQVLLSGQPRWMNFSMEQDGLQTKVYIPIQNGVVELASSNQITESAAVIQNVKAKCGDPWQEFQSFQEAVDQQGFKSLYKSQGVEDGLDKHFGHASDQLHWTSALESHPWDQDAVGLSDSQFALNIAPTQLNFLGKSGQQDSHGFDKPSEKASGGSLSTFVPSLQEVPLPASAQQQHGHTSFSDSPHGSGLSKENSEVKQETRADSSDCSDQVDDEDEKATGRSGRRHLSKNLVAERKRRKKLNERLYSLRALVPKITKMDRASILGDAIEYVKELQQQVKELQDELEDDSQAVNVPSALVDCVGLQLPPSSEGTLLDDPKCHASKADEMNSDKKMEDLTQPMQVEVSKMDAHLLTLRIFCEKRPGVFLKLMQALDALGLDVLHANITTFRGLVLNVFNAEIRDKELMQAEQVKETLLEMTSQPDSRGSSMATEGSHLGIITIDN